MKLMPADTVRALAEEARERYAREVLDINAVSRLIAEEGTAGFGGLRVRQDKAITLQGTRSAAKLQRWLLDGGYHLRWIEVPRKRKDGQLALHAELVITWEGDSDAFVKGVYELVRLEVGERNCTNTMALSQESCTIVKIDKGQILDSPNNLVRVPPNGLDY